MISFNNRLLVFQVTPEYNTLIARYLGYSLSKLFAIKVVQQNAGGLPQT